MFFKLLQADDVAPTGGGVFALVALHAAVERGLGGYDQFHIALVCLLQR